MTRNDQSNHRQELSQQRNTQADRSVRGCTDDPRAGLRRAVSTTAPCLSVSGGNPEHTTHNYKSSIIHLQFI